ncbi:hypothetical protein [Mangrovibacterium diazotrophicum]|uniref:GLPGLI family protein n=1 Tax=Mangrovibacterium diazotrophicum TaxID=1261403 RepID=A0A419W7W1_9BACT|nr:hypothetical protein [Mangrovibacterium diazotrophicum]RKD91571.1 hypothetical protein BC643_1927 [Mangrovibacterium diazotrophicum]
MRKVYLIIVLFVSLSSSVGAQSQLVDSLRQKYDEKYGLDVLLNNGRKYFPNNNPAKGHPYWETATPLRADLTVAGKFFPAQKVKYDLHTQQFVLIYLDENSREQDLVINNEAVDTIKIKEAVFIRNKFSEPAQPYLQVIHEGEIGCYISWSKMLQYNRSGTNIGYEYTAEKKNYFLLREGQLYRFSSKSNFLKIFPKEEKTKLKKYMVSNHIRFNKMSTNQLQTLIEYGEDIME